MDIECYTYSSMAMKTIISVTYTYTTNCHLCVYFVCATPEKHGE